jgi:hypothetical protein
MRLSYGMIQLWRMVRSPVLFHSVLLMLSNGSDSIYWLVPSGVLSQYSMLVLLNHAVSFTYIGSLGRLDSFQDVGSHQVNNSFDPSGALLWH